MDVPIQDAKVLKMLLCLFCQKIDVQVLIHTLPPSVITDELESKLSKILLSSKLSK